MILELKIKNFLSFKDEVTFSFEATKDKSFEDYQVVEVTEGVRILRLAIVYGANASGKSNLINAFDFLNGFWLNIPDNKDQNTGTIPFILDNDTPDLPSEFSLIFYINGTKYLYKLELDRNKVCSEQLYFYPGTQPAKLFDRKLEGNVSEIAFNTEKVKISDLAKHEITLKCLPNMSVLAAYNQVNTSVPEIDLMIEWIKNQIKRPITPTSSLIAFAESQITKSDSNKKAILNYLNRADFNITNISTEEIDEKIPDEFINILINSLESSDKEESERIKKEKTIKITQTSFEHQILNNKGDSEKYKMSSNLQSRGTMRTFGLSSAIKNTVDRNAFLAIDEIESSLHPKLVEFIIEDFFKQPGQSQLLLTTHYDGLLALDDLLRKDSIWFTSKKENGSTDLYSLTEFKGLNRISSLMKAYQTGRFGAIPNI